MIVLLRRRYCVAAMLMVTPFCPALAEPILGPDAEACRPGGAGPAVLVRIPRLKDRAGMLRVELYDNRADAFLEKTSRVRRVELVPGDGSLVICLKPPAPGDYVLVVLHDRNGNGKFDFMGDGVGFSRNPKLGLAKPRQADVLTRIGSGVQIMDIVMNYRRGLGVVPLP